MSILRLFTMFGLIAMNAFFAAAEYSLVAIRHSRVRQLAEAGDLRARVIEELLSDVSRVVSGVQVGVTLASLALGYIGEITLADFLHPVAATVPGKLGSLAAHTAALVLAFGLLTVLQVVLGELVPKTLTLARTERVALLVARPFATFLRIFSWAIDLLDGFAEKIVRLLGVQSPQVYAHVRSVEELQVLMEQAREVGVLPPAEAKFIQNAMELNKVQARELMVPRPDMHALPAEAGLEEAMKMFATTQRSRIPVYSGTVDHVVGFVHIKDLIWVLLDRARRAEEHLPQPEFQLRTHVRDVLIVPETKPASELLLEFRARRAGLAMVVDEFGSILGLITLEDILEQMVGEIHDEFDVIERPVSLADGSLIFDAALKLRDLEAQYDISLPDDPAYETIGGFVLSRLGFVPRGGESFEANGHRFTVMDMDRRRVSAGQDQTTLPGTKRRRAARGHARPASEGAIGRGGVHPTRSLAVRSPAAWPEMIRYLSLRILLTIPALWLILTMVFSLAHIVPGDPVQQMLGEGATPEDEEHLRHVLGLDQSLPAQYAHYLTGVMRGDLGESFRFQQPVLGVVLERYPATLELAFVAMLICAVIGIPAGSLAAQERGSGIDRGISVFTLLGLSMPNFALGPILILIFSVLLGWLPVSGRGGIGHLILPAITLGGALAAILTRMVRTSVIEELSSDYVRTARAKGLSDPAVLFRHAFRNALIPVLTIFGLQFGALLAGAIVTETIFSWPGIGRLSVQAIEARDYPLLQGCVLVIAVSYALVNLLTDVVYAVVDPRVRLQ